jgi:hypothetical protein
VRIAPLPPHRSGYDGSRGRRIEDVNIFDASGIRVVGRINTSAIFLATASQSKNLQRRCRKPMYAKHADDSELNERSGRVISPD